MNERTESGGWSEGKCQEECLRNRLKWAMERIEMKNWHPMHSYRKGNGDNEDGKCVERTAFRDVWKELEEHGDHQQETEGVGDC